MRHWDDLTVAQDRVLDYLCDYICAHGYGPSLREAGADLGCSSPNGVTCHLNALEKKKYITRDKRKARSIKLTDRAIARQRGLPLHGQVAAGLPVEAIEQQEWISFDDLLKQPDRFTLKVSGDSMRDAHILDGDHVVVRRTPEARNGQIVIVRTDDGDEATLKRFYREVDHIRLEPANPDFRTIRCHHVEVVGIVVGLVRLY